MFRSLGKSKITFVLAVLFGLSLFFFRGQERYSNLFNSDNVVASVSGTPISTTKFLRVMQMNINQYSQMLGRSLTAEEIQAFQIHSIALGNLVNNAVFENEFDSQKFIIDEKVVASETKKRFPNIYNKDNKLDELKLNSFLNQQSLKIDDLVKIIDYETRARIFEKLFFHADYPESMRKIINKYDSQSRNINLIKLNVSEFKLNELNNLNVSIDNKEIIEYFNQNINLYINPEKRDVSYVVINKNDYSNDFKPSNSQIEDYYNNNKYLFLIPQKRDFIQFNFKNKDEASKFKKNINSLSLKETIKFAKDNNIFYNEFTKLTQYEVLENLSKQIFSLKVNEVSSVVETPLANHVVIVKKIYSEAQKNFEQSKKEISEILLDVNLSNYILDLKNNINQEILNGASLNEIANSNLLVVKTLKNVERQFKETENSLITDKVIAKAFNTNRDFVSNIEDIDNDKSIIINVDKIEKEKPYELNQVFELVSNDWIKSLKIKKIQNFINEVSSKPKSIVDISKYVNTEFTNTNLTLNNNDYPSSFKNKIFNSKLNEITLSDVSNDIFIGETISITFPKEVAINKNTLSVLSELRSNFGAEIIKTKKISTNDNLIQALISQY